MPSLHHQPIVIVNYNNRSLVQYITDSPIRYSPCLKTDHFDFAHILDIRQPIFVILDNVVHHKNNREKRKGKKEKEKRKSLTNFSLYKNMHDKVFFYKCLHCKTLRHAVDMHAVIPSRSRITALWSAPTAWCAKSYLLTPRLLGVYYFLSLTLFVCLYVCNASFKSILLLFFSMESSHFLTISSP